MSKEERTLLLAGGGTGGHLIPGLVLAEELFRKGGLRPLLVTGTRPVEDRVLAGAPWERVALDLEGSPFRILARLPRAFFRLQRAAESSRLLGVLVLGGRIGLPAAFMARALGRPLYLLEINALPGKTTRFLAPFARKVYLGYPSTARFFRPGRRKVTGIPVRPSFLDLPTREEALESLGLDPVGGPVLLVMGGSMGAQALNRALPALLSSPGGIPRETQVVHVSGPAMKEEVEEAWKAGGMRAKVFPYLRAMEMAFAAADLAVCRGGAMTMGEVAAARLPAVVVPYPWHKDMHQAANAAPLARAGGVEVLPQDRLEEEAARRVAALLGNPDRLKVMRKALAGVDLAAPAAPLAEDLLVEGGVLRG